MKQTVITLLLLWSISLSAQNDQGTIVYERKMDYTKLFDSFSWMSEEEKLRRKMSWGKMSSGRGAKYNLTFTPDKMVYTYGAREKTNSYSWKQDEFLMIDEVGSTIVKHQMVINDKLYVVEDERPKFKWKVENELREIAGYMCIKAVTTDTIKNQTIVAWFTNQLPVSAGPEGYHGLPGMILMLDINDGTATIEATSVTMEVPKHPIPKKIKGKKISFTKYQEILAGLMKDSEEEERNPFWAMRY